MSGWQDALKGKAVSAVYRQHGFGPTAEVTQEATSVPLETPNTSNLRQHWSVTARRTKGQREALKRKIRLWLNSHGPPRLRITVVRVSPRQVDGPNLGSCLKGAIDGIADGLRIDDGSPLVEWKLEQRKGPAAVEWRIEVAP